VGLRRRRRDLPGQRAGDLGARAEDRHGHRPSVQRGFDSGAVSVISSNLYLAAQMAILPAAIAWLHRRSQPIYRKVRTMIRSAATDVRGSMPGVPTITGPSGTRSTLERCRGQAVPIWHPTRFWVSIRCLNPQQLGGIRGTLARPGYPPTLRNAGISDVPCLGRHCLPCRRSRVRIPSAAFKKAPQRRCFLVPAGGLFS
jgi:hypothetical protein